MSESSVSQPRTIESRLARLAAVARRAPLGGEELNRKFYAAAGEPKTLWRTADAGHTDGLPAHPRGYERRVIAFLDHALLSTR